MKKLHRAQLLIRNVFVVNSANYGENMLTWTCSKNVESRHAARLFKFQFIENSAQ